MPLAACQGGPPSSIGVGNCTLNQPSLAFEGLYMKAAGSAACTSTKTRTYRLEIKADNLGPLPDPLVAASTDSGTKRSYSRSFGSCDNGHTKTYYSKAFFQAGEASNSISSAHIKHQVC